MATRLPPQHIANFYAATVNAGRYDLARRYLADVCKLGHDPREIERLAEGLIVARAVA